MKIKQIILLLFISLSALPMILLGVINVRYYNNKLEDVLESDLKNSVTTQAQAIEFFLNERRLDAAVISELKIIEEILKASADNDKERVRQLRPLVEDSFLTRMRNGEFVETISIIDKNYYVIASTISTAVGKYSTIQEVDQKYITPELYFTPVSEVSRPDLKKKIITGIQGIFIDNKLQGYLAIELNLSYFEKIRLSSDLYNNGTIYLLDQNNHLITAGNSSSSRSDYVTSAEDRKSFMEQMNHRDRSKPDGFILYTIYGEQYLSYYSQLPQTNWIMISSVNVNEVLQTKKGVLRVAQQIFVVLLILYISVNYLMAKYLIKPISNMALKFKEIRDQQDYSIRMNANANNEIGSIASEINSLLADIETYIFKEKEIRKQLEDMAMRDPLTNLLNKNAIEQLLSREIEQARINGTKVACIYIDIDDFKNFNTNYGHEGGDKVLLYVSKILTDFMGPFVGRQGGDEFMVCIPNIKSTLQVESVISLVMEKINAGILLNKSKNPVTISCSFGAVISDGHESQKELIVQADLAMYKAKKNGKANYYITGTSHLTNVNHRGLIEPPL